MYVTERGPTLETVNSEGILSPEKSFSTRGDIVPVHVLINVLVYSLRSDRDARSLRLPDNLDREGGRLGG